MANSAAGHYSLVVMTVVAAVFAPLVIAYQAWSYHVLQGRVQGSPAEITTTNTAAGVQVASDQPGNGAQS